MIEVSRKIRPFANTTEFYTALGLFYAAWSRTELAIDSAMWKASGTETAERAHECSARTKFSAKCKHFRTLLGGGKIPNDEKVKDLLTRIEQGSMRNVLAHSFMATDEHSVTFIHRKVERGKYQPTSYTIACDDFIDHVQSAFNSPSTSSKQSDCHTRKWPTSRRNAFGFARWTVMPQIAPNFALLDMSHPG